MKNPIPELVQMQRSYRFLSNYNRLFQFGLSLMMMAALVFSMPLKALAEVEIWAAEARDGDWTSNLNWEGFGGIRPDDDLIFRAPDNFDYDPDTGAFSFRPNNDFAFYTRFRSIRIEDSRFIITGNPISLTAGISNTAANFSTGATFSPSIRLDANQTFSTQANRLVLNGFVNLNGRTLTVAGNGAGIVFNNTINGTGTIVKNNGGTLVVNGNAASFGDTFLNAGAIEVNGSLGRVSMQGGALQGTGTINGGIFSNFGSGGRISPGKGGNNRGTLNVNGQVSLNTASSFRVDVQNSFVGGQCDRMHVFDGNVDLNGASLIVSVVQIPVPGTQFVIIEQVDGGTITGQFAEGSTVISGGQLFSITYTFNTVILTALGTVGP